MITLTFSAKIEKCKILCKMIAILQTSPKTTYTIYLTFFITLQLSLDSPKLYLGMHSDLKASFEVSYCDIFFKNPVAHMKEL